MASKVAWITINGKQTQEQRRVASILGELYTKLLKKFRISRALPLYLVDESSWTNKQGLNLNQKSVAHYNEGIRIGKGVAHEAILLREAVLFWEDTKTAIPKLLKHELTHAKLKGKEGKSSKHNKLFKETAKKFSAAQIGDF